MQRLQAELRSAHILSQMVLQRELQKKASFQVEREVWEAKWKLYETKRRWPSLGMTKEEEEMISGRAAVQPGTAGSNTTARIDTTMLNGAHALQPQSTNVPSMRKKQSEKDREEKERRERAIEAARNAEKGIATGGRSLAPESLKERVMALQQKLEEAMARRKARDAEWDDFTDVSFGSSQNGLRPTTSMRLRMRIS